MNAMRLEQVTVLVMFVRNFGLVSEQVDGVGQARARGGRGEGKGKMNKFLFFYCRFWRVGREYRGENRRKTETGIEG